MTGAEALGIAVIGGGFMATVHSRAARAAGARLVGVLSSGPEKSESARTQLGFERAYSDLPQLLADPNVNVVQVCTPNALHTEQTLAALAAGKHVICEKPLATSSADAALVVAAADETTRVGTVPFVYRFHPLVREARARVASGQTGAVLTITGSYLQDWLLSSTDDNWRVDAVAGGPSRAFADIGSHLVDLVEFVAGERITRLAAVTRTVHPERSTNRAVATEDAVALSIQTASGAIGSLLISQVAPGRKNRLSLEISGTTETVSFDQEQPETLWIGRRTGSTLLPRDADQLHPDAARLCTVPAGHPQGYQDAFTAFMVDSYQAVRGNPPEGLPTFRDGQRAVEVTAAMLTSASIGGWVDVPSTLG